MREFECNAEAIICGESYEVRVVEGPDEEDMLKVDVPFWDAGFVESLWIPAGNVFPKGSGLPN